MSFLLCGYVLCIVVAAAAPAAAQAPTAPAPEPAWTGSLSAGFAVTGGNTSTTTVNFAFDVQSAKSRRNVIKAEGLNLRSTQNGDSIVDRTSVSARDEYRFSTRAYVFGQIQYLHDVFKSIDYLIAPTGGVGYKVFDTEATAISTDLAVGAVTEKNSGLRRSSSGAVTLNQKLSQKLSTVASASQSFNGLWRADDFGDGLYTFQAGVAASIIGSRVQIKLDFLDSYKSRPPGILVKKNDTTLITSFAFKF